MDKDPYNVLVKELRGYVKKWTAILGLERWLLKFEYYDKPPPDLADAYARVYPDWEYMQANVKVNLRTMNQLPPDEREHTMLHELLHIVLDQLTDSPKQVQAKVEELTATTLAFGLKEAYEAGKRARRN